nr:hypothetical protein [Streptomyces otsuchiensis]
MPLHASGSDGDDTFPAICAHTHLFPGSRCRVRELPDPQGFAAAPRPLGLDLRFSDGVVSEAELLVADSGDAVLTVAARTTAAGTGIDGQTWIVRSFERSGDEVELTLGSRSDRARTAG